MVKQCCIVTLLAWAGCGVSEEKAREIIREELNAAADHAFITSAQVVGPYSPAVRVGRFLFVSGQLGLHAETMEFAGNDIETQTRQALDNLMAILREAGMDSTHVVQCTVLLKDIKDFQRMNLIYGGYFDEHRYPARTTVAVAGLPRNALIEIAAIAHRGNRP